MQMTGTGFVCVESHLYYPAASSPTPGLTLSIFRHLLGSSRLEG